MYKLIVIVVLHHNLRINSLLLIHHILGKLNIIVRLARRALNSHQCSPRPKKFGDLCTMYCKKRFQTALALSKPDDS